MAFPCDLLSGRRVPGCSRHVCSPPYCEGESKETQRQALKEGVPTTLNGLHSCAVMLFKCRHVIELHSLGPVLTRIAEKDKPESSFIIGNDSNAVLIFMELFRVDSCFRIIVSMKEPERNLNSRRHYCFF